jgi:hypothetical protein
MAKNKFVLSFGGEVFDKMVTWKTKEEMDLRKTDMRKGGG